MASTFSPSIKSRAKSLSYDAIYFQRKKEIKRVKKKKKKKNIIKFRHIIFSFMLIGSLFFCIQQAYFLLVSWDYLNIKEITVVCTKEIIKQEVEQIMAKQTLSNIFLLNISQLRFALKSNLLVKEAHIRKIFPSQLKIIITEREPFAVVNRGGLYLVDEEGIQLERIYANIKTTNLPLLIDSQNFQKYYKEKIILAWECLKNVSDSEKENIYTLDLSDLGWVTVSLKNEPTKIKLSKNEFAQNLNFFHKNKRDLELRFGPLKYVDLRFEDRIYIKPLDIASQSVIPNPEKEVQ